MLGDLTTEEDTMAPQALLSYTKHSPGAIQGDCFEWWGVREAWTGARKQQELLEKQGPEYSSCQPTGQHVSTVARRTRKPPRRKKKKKKRATKSAAGRPRTSLSRSIWRRLDTGCPGQLLQQTKIALPPASKGTCSAAAAWPRGHAGWGIHPALPACSCLRAGWTQPTSQHIPCPLTSESYLCTVCQGLGKPSACHRRVKIQQVIYLKYQCSNASVLAFGSFWL